MSQGGARWTTRSARTWRRATRSTSRSSCWARRSMGDEVLPDVRVALPLSRVNRHGLIAGATGTGKTKTLQLLAGQLSAAGVPVFAVDVKGDLSGVGAPGDPANPNVVGRSESLRWTFQAQGHPVEILSLSGRHRRPRARQRQLLRAAAPGQGPGPQRHPDQHPVPGLPLLRRRAPPAPGPRRPADHPQVPGLGRGQADPRGPGRHQPGVARRDPALDRDPRAGGRRRSSSASPSSTWTTSCARRPTARAS